MPERPDFERVLAEHEDYGLYSDAGGDTHYVCACDKVKRPGNHRAHIAAALHAAVARRLADEGTREVSARAIHDHQEYTTYWDDDRAGAKSRMGTPMRPLGEHGREFYVGLATAALAALAPTADALDGGR